MQQESKMETDDTMSTKSPTPPPFKYAAKIPPPSITDHTFMTAPLNDLVDPDQSNYEIAQVIKQKLDAVDSGDYAVIVSDQKIENFVYTLTCNKKRECKVNGKYLFIYKQAASQISKVFDRNVVRSCLVGIIIHNEGNNKNIAIKMGHVFGSCWAVYVGSGACYYHCSNNLWYKIKYKNKVYTVWKQPHKQKISSFI